MSKFCVLGLFVALTAGGSRDLWIHFSSSVYPYAIAQPSSFRHVVLQDTTGRKLDYFFPNLGSFITNVNVFAVPGHGSSDSKSYLEGSGGRNIRKSEMVMIGGRRLPLVRADFHGIAGRWTEEQISFASQGVVWRLTASFDPRYKKLLPAMLHMLKSFQPRPVSRRQ